MSDSQRIANAIYKLGGGAASQDKPDVFTATVDSVDELARTCSCTLLSGKTDISLTSVRLMANVDDGILYIPTVGSDVMIECAKNYDPYITMFSGLDKIFLVGGSGSFLVWAQGLELNGKNFGGLVQVIPLVSKINALENLLNDLIQKFNTHIHPGVQTGGGSTLITTTQETNIISPTTQRSDIENTTVQHGDDSGSNLEED